MLTKYVVVLLGACAALIVGAITVVVLLALLASTGLNDSIAFGITLLVATTLGMAVGSAALRKLRKIGK